MVTDMGVANTALREAMTVVAAARVGALKDAGSVVPAKHTAVAIFAVFSTWIVAYHVLEQPVDAD